MTNCQSCGMPMNAPTDFGGGRTDNLYCRYCADASGNLLPREVVRQNMIQFYAQTVGKTSEEAAIETDKIMATMPAWKIQASPVAPVIEPTPPVPPVSAPMATPSSEPVPPVQPPASEPLVSEPTTIPIPPTTEDKPQ